MMQDTTRVSSYPELQAHLAGLPPPSAGLKRVFRGQPQHYPAMRATGMRGLIARKVIWRTYARILVQDLAAQSPEGLDEIYLWFFWLDAIAQHYGPGSHFLDVSHSVDVALWFALHKAKEIESVSIIGPKGPLNREHDLVTTQTWCKYEPHREGDAWLYVFDAPDFRTAESLDHGTLIDLAHAPPAFSQSARVRAQQGCLLLARPEHDQGNLNNRFACPPIRVDAAQMVFAGRDRPTEEIFPRPTADPWYARLLSIPVTPQITPDGSNVEFSQPLEVRPYWPEVDQTIVEEVRARRISLAPPIYATKTIAQAKANGGVYVKWGFLSRTSMADASVLVVEGQVFFTTPPVASGMWNEGLLAEDAAEEAGLHDGREDKVSRQIPLGNLLFEFSPLEHAGWERIEKDGNGMQPLRTVWYVRKGARTVLTYFFQSLPTGEEQSVQAEFVFDSTRRRFRVTPFGKNTWKDATSVAPLAKAFFAIRTLLRDLSPTAKATPYPLAATSVVEHGVPSNQAILGVMGKACMLARAKNNPDLAFVRGPTLHDPYIGPGGIPDSHPRGSIVVTHTGKFCDVDPAHVRARLAAAT